MSRMPFRSQFFSRVILERSEESRFFPFCVSSGRCDLLYLARYVTGEEAGGRSRR
jgi:hypothetical protein